MPRPPTRGARPTAGPPWDVFWENAGSNFASLLGPWPPTARYRPTGVWGGWQGRTRRSGGRHPVRCTRVADRVGYPGATLLLSKGGEGLRIQRDAGLRQPLNRGNILAPTRYHPLLQISGALWTDVLRQIAQEPHAHTYI